MKILILGASGQMGQLFARLLKQDHEIINFDVLDWKNLEQVKYKFNQADLILLAVTMDKTTSVISQISPYVKSNQGLCDLTSIKLPILTEMLKKHAGPVLGLHPIFGPNITSYQWPLVICEGREQEFFKDFLKSLKDWGFNFFELSAEYHDQLMDIIQGLNYSALRAYIKFMPEKDQEKSLLWPVIKKFKLEDQNLYDSIIHATPSREKYILNFKKFAQGNLEKIFLVGDLFGNLSEYVGCISPLPLRERSSHEVMRERGEFQAAPSLSLNTKAFRACLSRGGRDDINPAENKKISDEPIAILLCFLELIYFSQNKNMTWDILKKTASPNFLYKLNLMSEYLWVLKNPKWVLNYLNTLEKLIGEMN